MDEMQILYVVHRFIAIKKMQFANEGILDREIEVFIQPYWR